MINGFNVENVFYIASPIIAIIGGGFALFQWRKGNIYKRAEILQKLIETIRDDEDISAVMDVIDWNEGFSYYGKFKLSDKSRTTLSNITDDDFFHMVDKTLAHFSYICYLRNQRTLTKKDMCVFEYALRRLMDNRNIKNYLYSLYHWSASLNTAMSFSFLIKYGLKKGYLSPEFKYYPATCYICYLKLPQPYISKVSPRSSKQKK